MFKNLEITVCIMLFLDKPTYKIFTENVDAFLELQHKFKF